MEKRRIDGEKKGEDHETLKPCLSWILCLTLSASIGGLLVRYYVGFIIARFGVLSDLDSILHETIRTGLVGAILGAAAGGWTNDYWGRKFSILLADTMILIGGVSHMLLLYTSNKHSTETIGNLFIALGVGMASMTSPLFISEISPPKLRDFLVSINFILYGIGKFTFFFLYIESIRTSSYIIALAGIPALFQFCVMFSCSETPMWLYKKDRQEDAIKAWKNIYTCFEVEEEFDSFRLSITKEILNEEEISYSGTTIFSKIRSAWSSPSIRKQFVVGTSLQIVKQLVGMNALIYCAASIRKLSGFGASDSKTDIEVMQETLGGSHGVISIVGGLYCTFILGAGYGKRKILCWGIYCMLGIVLCLSFIFTVSPNTVELVSRSESSIYFSNHTCLSYITAPDANSWDCLTCLHASTGCGFCRGIHYNILGQSSGACLIAQSNGKSQVCIDENRTWNTKYCKYNIFRLPIILGFHFYSLCYSTSLEIIPWIINSQMYPTKVRGIYGGIVAAADWIFFLVIIILSFVFSDTQGLLFTFLLITIFCLIVSWLIKKFLPKDIHYFDLRCKNKMLLIEL